ncbi:MAG: flavodoxin family protein [Desulfarculus sp.]|jgi:putative NADPH-quinone reductase|nr:MAG: flavodoxin family protein [Desulfarculus sp.]
MGILLVLAHPAPQSFNHAIAQTARQTLEGLGHQVIFRDLYREDFDPLLEAEEFPRSVALPPLVQEHCRELAAAQGIVVVHPNWWGMPPAIMKGWIDRVFRPGVAYEFMEGDNGEGVPRGLLRARAALVLNTANTPPAREQEVFGDPLERLWRDCVFGLCGVGGFHRRTFSVVVTSSGQQRRQWLAEVAQTVARLFPAES